MKQFYVAITCFLLCGSLLGQELRPMPAIPAMRVLHHEYIIESVKKVALLYRVREINQITDTNPTANIDTVQILNAL